MKESDLNNIIRRNICEQNGWAHKIADPAGIAAKMASQNPFDGFGYTDKFNIVWESKLIKQDFKAFNFNDIRDHQISHLSKIREITKNQSMQTICAITLGIWIPRHGITLFVFSIDYINNLMKLEKKSILKKELLQLRSEEKCIEIKKESFNINELKIKLIEGN